MNTTKLIILLNHLNLKVPGSKLYNEMRFELLKQNIKKIKNQR